MRSLRLLQLARISPVLHLISPIPMLNHICDDCCGVFENAKETADLLKANLSSLKLF